MSSKRVSFASALVCAAFVPQAMGVCASGNGEVIVDKVAEKHKDYLGKGKGVTAPKGSKTDDDFDLEGFGFNVKTRKKTVRRGGVLSKVFDRAFSFKKRYGKLVDLSKKVAVCGSIGYSVISFTGPMVDIISKKSALDPSLIPSGVGQNISGLMLDPSVDFGFLLKDVDGEKQLSEKVKKESVSDIAGFLSVFVDAYKETGGKIDLEKFKSGIEADFGNKQDRERMSVFCKNLRSLPVKSISRRIGLSGKTDDIVKQLDYASVSEYQKIASLLNESEKGKYHGLEEGGKDLTRDLKNMWEGGKKAAMEVGGETLSSVGSSLTMALPGYNKVVGVVLTVVGILCKHFSNEEKMQDQKNLRS